VDRSSVLGTAVLAYALLTSGTLLFIKSGWPDAGWRPTEWCKSTD
jgi:hypothetical protein